MTGLIEALRPVLEIVLKVLLELWWEKADELETITDVDRDPARRERLRRRVREAAGRARAGG